MDEELKVVISAEISDLENNIQQATDTVQQFAEETETADSQSSGSFSGISAAAAAQFAIVSKVVEDAIDTIKQFVSNALSYGDTVDKQSQKMQMSKQSFQEWSYVLQRNGADISALKKGINNITGDLGDMAMGVDVDTAAYDALGVSLQNADGSMRSSDDVLKDCILSLADMEDTTMRNKLAQDIFGRSFMELLPMLNSGKDGVEELIGVADEYAVITDEQAAASARVKDAQLTMNDALQKVGSTMATALAPVLETICNALADAFNWLSKHPAVLNILVGVIGALAAALAVMAIQQTVANLAMAACPAVWIIAAIGAVIGIIVTLIQHWDEVSAKVTEVWDSITEKIGSAVDSVVGFITDLVGKIKEKFQQMKDNIKEKVDNIKSNVVNTFQNIKSGIEEKVQNAKEAVRNKFEEMKSAVTDKVNNIKQKVGDVFGNIKSVIQEKITAAKTTVTTIFDNIKSAISEKIEAAKEKVHSAIEKIKGFFNFSWSLPHLKLPHISITGSFSLAPPSVPHFGISWYAQGGVFDQPTLFPMGGLGEAGAEAIVPLENNTEWLDRIAERLNGNKPIVLTVNDKVFAQTAIESINRLTSATGRLGLVLR